MRHKSYPVLSIGFSSILTVFIILSLTVFAMLSVVSAGSDARLTRQAVEQTDAYYNASNQAEEIYAQIDRILYGCFTESGNKQEYLANCRSAFSTGAAIDNASVQYDETGDMPQLSYQASMSGTQVLSVVLSIQYPESTGEKFCCVSVWQTSDTREWNPDTSLPVYGKDSNGSF